MAEPTPELQFDRAELEGASPTAATVCAACQKTLTDEYHQVGSLVTCESCRRQLEQEWTRGSGLGRFARAALLGTLAAVVCAGLYAGLTILLSFHFSLVAIAVGYVVGRAVRAGGRRGGWAYQGLAMFLTYSAIVFATLGAEIYQEGTGDILGSGDPGALMMALRILLLIPFVYLMPFLGGWSSLLWIIIIGIGVYEAWQLNRKVVLPISGPYRLAAPPGPPAA